MRVPLSIQFSPFDESWQPHCQTVLKYLEENPEIAKVTNVKFVEEHEACVIDAANHEPAWFKVDPAFGDAAQAVRAWVLRLGEVKLILRPTVGTSKLKTGDTYYVLGVEVHSDTDERKASIFRSMTRIISNAWALDNAEAQSIHQLADRLDETVARVQEAKKQGARNP